MAFDDLQSSDSCADNDEILRYDYQENASRYVFLMSDYTNILHEVFKKNICPFAKYQNVEMAVFFYIQNICHKCESILMDYWEYLTLGDVKKLKNTFQKTIDNDGKTSCTELLSNYEKQCAKVNNRLKRIYGSTHESVDVEEEDDDDAQMLLNKFGGAAKMMKKPLDHWLELKKCSSLNKKERLIELEIEEKEGIVEIGNVLGSFANKAKSGAGEGLNLIGDGTKMLGSLQTSLITKNLQGKLAKQKTQKLLIQWDDEKQRKEINKLIDKLFVTSKNKIPTDIMTKIFPDDPKESMKMNSSQRFDYSFLDEEMFKLDDKKITNYLSKQNNKYCFKLMQIFGFRNEKWLSLIDKDEMKKEYFYLKKDSHK